jgi:DNA-binding HxlR family transcriptional regulator
MATKRSYGDRCGIARALDVVGERWALLVVRELLLGPKRFTDLRAGLPHLGPDVLSQRLRDLEAAGIVRRGTLPPPSDTRVYELTPRGAELEPVVLALGAWGSRAPLPDGDARLGVDSAVLALKTLFDPAAAGSIDEELELRLDGERFRARVANGALEVARGAANAPLAIIRTDPATLSRVLWHGRKLSAAMRSGDVRIEGDVPVARRFLALFPAPEPAAAAPASPQPAASRAAARKPAASERTPRAGRPAARNPRRRQSPA